MWIQYVLSKFNKTMTKNTSIIFKALENVSHNHKNLPYSMQSIVEMSILSRNFTSSTKMLCGKKFKLSRPLPVKMKGIQVCRFGDEKELKVNHDLVLPVQNLEDLKPNEVLVKVIYAGINPVDTYIRSGAYAVLPSVPYIPGMDAAGYIEAIGSEVCEENFSLGSRVFITGPGKNSGSYAEYVKTEQSYVYPLDDRLSFPEGACLGIPYFTALKALMYGAKARKHENVLVHGASGAVGCAAVQIANYVGAKVYGTAGTEKGMEVVANCGAHHVFNHNEEDYEINMKAKTNGEGFDVIIENLANVNLDKDMQMIKKNARIMIVGSRGQVTISPRHLMAPEASIIGMSLWPTTDVQYQKIARVIHNGIISGWVKPIIDKEYSIEDAPKAHHDIIYSKGAKGNLILRIC